jgi:hypothetical protein
MKRRSVYLTGLLLPWMLAWAGSVHAGPADTPLPTFSDGKPAVAVYHATGVIKNNNLETDFVCTSLEATPVDIGVELFDETGALRNSVAAGEGAFLNVAPGKTVTVGTAGTVAFHEDLTITLNGAGTGANLLRNGSGRVVGTSKNVLCTALVADKLHAIADPAVSSVPPPPFTSLPLIKLP